MKGELKDCEHCGEPFTKRRADSKFCSQKCLARVMYLRKKAGNAPGGNFKTELPYQECLNCQAELTHMMKLKKAKYCSRDCVFAHQSVVGKNFLPRNCNWCGIEFTPAMNDNAVACSIQHQRKSWEAANRPGIRESKKRWVAGNREHHNAMKRKHRSENPESYRQMFLRSYIKHGSKWKKSKPTPEARRRYSRFAKYRRRRRIESAGDYLVTKRFERQALARCRGLCTYCGIEMVDTSVKTRLEWDHVVPIARGGANGEGNLLPCCGSCNRSKGSKLLVEWRRRQRIERQIRCQ